MDTAKQAGADGNGLLCFSILQPLSVLKPLVDAYREHLVVAQQRLEGYGKQRADELEGERDRLSPAELFALSNVL